MDSAAQTLVAETACSPPRSWDAARDGDLLAQAARPVVKQLARDLAGTGIGIVLTDANGQVIEREASGAWIDAHPVGVGAAAPITEARTGRTLGTLGLRSWTAATNPLMRPFVTRAVREIEQRVTDHSGLAERLALGRYLQERRSAKGPFVLVTDRRLIPNAAADRLVGPEDETVLRQAADRLLAGRDGDVVTLVIRGGAATVRAQRPPDDESTGCVVLQLRPLTRTGQRTGNRRGRTSATGADLTDTERSVAQLVADGLTNREVAERLFLSPHTVDFHLRSIFRKLGASSRVQLARLIVLTQHETEEG
jgi:DNA-binding CsgD family transcriptional regulator